MPFMSSSWYWFVTASLVGFALFLTAALHVYACAANTPIDLDHPHRANSYAWTAIAATLLMLVFVIGHSFTRTTFYNAFLLDVLFWPLVTVWFIAIFLAPITSGSIMRLDNRWWERWLLVGCCLAFALVGLWWSTIVAQWLINQVTALRVGPLADIGVVTAKDSIRSTQSVIINGYHYEVPDYLWWRTLALGKSIAFVRDPARALAFAPTQITWTWDAGVIMVCGGLIWLWTLGFIGRSLTTRGRY
jgi:hypothetical protein